MAAGIPTQSAAAVGRLGAVPLESGRVELRVWAPAAGAVSAVVGGDEHALERGEGGMWEAVVPGAPGDTYGFRLDGGRPLADPCSRWQPDGLRGLSRVLDTGAFAWTDDGWDGVALDELVIYELHVGTFTPEGTFDAVIPRLEELRELGVTAIELLPVATVPGERGWGYDGVLTWAPHRAYGGPHGLARLVDAAHAAGLGVILDVVYNHIGPGSELVTAFGPYTTPRHSTFWGDALDYAQPAVREWAIGNAEQWVRDYHVDGLRLDAVHTVFDDESPRHVLAELADRVRAARPGALVTAEMEVGDLRPVRDWGHDAQWADALHHALHVALTGEADGYYADGYGSMARIAEELTRPELPRYVVCAQNHDQVGNRALGDRLPPDALRVAAFVSILSGGVPLLFQGEEYAEHAPFRFFTDHDDPAIADATREGRRREFAAFAAFSGEEVPDPQAEETFLVSKLDAAAGDPEHRALYREWLRLRRELRGAPVEILEADEEARRLVFRRGGFTFVADFERRAAEVHAP